MSKERYNPKFDDDEQQPDKSKTPNAADIYLETPPPPPIPYRRPQGGATLRGGHLTVGAFTLTDLGLQVDGNASQDDWAKIGEMLFKLEGSIQWLIGDWLAFGENVEWGDITVIADALGKDRNTLYGYVSVCREFDMLRRRNILSFGHHREVMGYDPDHQDIALAYAAENKLSVAAFRKWLKEQQGKAEPPALPAQETTSTFKALSGNLDKLFTVEPSQAKPQQHIQARTAYQLAAERLEQFRRKWGL